MFTTSEVKVGERQFHNIDQRIGSPLIPIDGTIRAMEKLCVDIPRNHGKWKTYVIRRISMPRRAHILIKEEWKNCRNQIRIFKKEYMEKMGA